MQYLKLVLRIALCHLAILSNSISQTLSGFADSAVFKFYAHEAPLGSMTYSLDKSGNYQRKFTMTYAGQTVVFEMSVAPDDQGNWQTMEIINPAMGTINVTHHGNLAKFTLDGKENIVTLPGEYVLYDDYGTAFESLMLKKYDLIKKGKQTFKRFRFVEVPQIPNNIIDIRIEYKGVQSKTIQGKEWKFMIFNWRLLGVNAEYWVDPDFKIYKIKVPAEYSVAVREGFEALLDFKTEGATIPPQKQTIQIPLRDGIQLATDLYFPEKTAGKFPIVFIRTPYKKEMQELDGFYWAKQGYVCAIQDVRGRFASEGEWEPFVNEAADGHDAIEWLAAQEWSNGKVGMIGASYSGWVQLWAASQQPPHLVTIIPNVAPPDPFYNLPYEYGSFFTLGALWWAEVVENEATDDISGKKLGQIGGRDYGEILSHLPVIDLDQKIFNRENRYWRRWIQHNTNDAYWERANYLDKLKNLDIPVFLQSGWFDGDAIGTKLAYLKLKESKNKNIKMIVGPWGHTAHSTTFIGSHEVGEEAALDLQALYLRWFDYWLKGIDNKLNAEPLVQLYTLKSKKWLTANTYPLPQTKFVKFYLISENGANSLKGDGGLGTEIPVNDRTFDEYTYDPGNPTPAPQFRYQENGRKSYLQITSSRKDILVYQTEPLPEPFTIAGPISAVIYAASSAKDTDWFVTLQAEEQTGGIIPLAKGTIRARFRKSMSQPELLEPDQIYEYSIDLWHTGITFEKGERIRVEIASAYFPYFSRNLNTGGHNELETDFVPAEQKIFHSKEYPSHILLPVVDLNDFTAKAEPLKAPTHAASDEATKAASAILETYPGSYQLQPNFILEITRTDDTLWVKPTGQPKEQLFAIAENKFHTQVGKAELTFFKDESGRVGYILVDRDGYHFQARNLANPKPEAPKTPKAIEMNPEIYDNYVGDYELAANQVITITRQDSRLFVQLTGQPKLEIYPESASDFFYTVVDARITFVKENAAKVSHLVLHQNGMDLQANRK